MAQQIIDIGAAPNDGTGDPIRDAFDKCNDNFTELYTGLTGLLDFKGSTDCSANPNYPAASKGDFYVVSVAGKIGGASGVDVEVGDAYFAEVDNAGGTQAAVGTSWTIIQGNTTGAGAGINVEDEGVSEGTGITTLNFSGAGCSVIVTGAEAEIIVPGGGVSDLDDLSDVDTTGASSGDVLTYDGAQWEPQAPSGSELAALFEDQKAANTAGGTATSGAWTARVLNTSLFNDIPSVSLSSNQISIPAGTYEVDASGPFHGTGRSRHRIRDVTNNVTLALSENGLSSTTDASATIPRVLGRFTVAGTVAIELQYRVATTVATQGLGVAANFAELEVYGRIKLTKLA